MISGIIPNLEMDKSICSTELLLRSSDEVDGEIHRWDHLVNRPDNQGATGTCEARAECGRAEVLINDSLGDQFAGDKQIDAISVYRRAHEIRYPGKKINYNSGLQLGDSLQACIELGIYPKDANIARIKVLPYDVAEALKVGPLVVAQNVHDGWKPGNVNQFTGEIADAPVLGIAGHAVLAIGINLGEQGTVLVTLVNSWDIDWGWNGLMQIPFGMFRYNSLDNPILVEIDPMWWKTSTKWREYQVYAPNGVVPIL